MDVHAFFKSGRHLAGRENASGLDFLVLGELGLGEHSITFEEIELTMSATSVAATVNVNLYTIVVNEIPLGVLQMKAGADKGLAHLFCGLEVVIAAAGGEQCGNEGNFNENKCLFHILNLIISVFLFKSAFHGVRQ